jgi:hypothetical protein
VNVSLDTNQCCEGRMRSWEMAEGELGLRKAVLIFYCYVTRAASIGRRQHE